MNRRIRLKIYKQLFWFDRPDDMTIKALNGILHGENDLISLNQNDVRNLVTGSNYVAVSYRCSINVRDAVHKAINTMQKRFIVGGATQAIMQIVLPKETTLDALSLGNELIPFNSIPITYGLKVKENTMPIVFLMVSISTKETNYVKNQKESENF